MSTTPHTIRIAAVDDDTGFLDLLSEAIAPHPDLQLCATATTLHGALHLLDDPPVDVLLVDLGLPDGSGMALIERAALRWPACEVLVSTAFANDASVIDCFEAGASGYLVKQQQAGRLADDIRMLHAGGSPISPMLARQVMQRLVPERPGHAHAHAHVNVPGVPGVPSTATESDAQLSSRELEVLALITKGFTTDEIAALMKLSNNTVLTYVRRTYSKLRVRSRTEAIFEARSQGLIP